MSKDFQEQLRGKYAGKSDPVMLVEHAAAMNAIVLCADLIGGHRERIQATLDAERYMHSVGGLIDPTLYKDMTASKNFKQQMRLLDAALAFVREVDAVKAEILAGK